VVPERQPYAGELVFTAFSGSHQDAIKKGFDRREKEGDATAWAVPYLTIDPEDIGRSYESIVRINSQSGKGGVAYILNKDHGFDLPKTMHPQVGKRIYDLADEESRELSVAEVGELFHREFVNLESELAIVDYELDHHVGERGEVGCIAKVTRKGEEKIIKGVGNGPINAFVNAMEQVGWKDFTLTDYRSHSVRGGSGADAAAYVQLRKNSGEILWGTGVDPSIEMAGVRALVSAWNLLRKKP
jgi:2-isopropylmalate synthase